MPGLLPGVARTAVVAGTATAVSNRVSRRQASRWAQDDQSAYPQDYVGGAQPSQPVQPQYIEAAPAVDPLEQLTKLGQLHESGVLTDAEFEAQKAKILAG
jgi:hypothetical protein